MHLLDFDYVLHPQELIALVLAAAGAVIALTIES